MEVAVACYGAEGTLLLGEAAGQQERSSKLVGLARDLSKAPVGTATGTYAGGPGLRETVTELGSAVPGAYPMSSCLSWLLGQVVSAQRVRLWVPWSETWLLRCM